MADPFGRDDDPANPFGDERRPTPRPDERSGGLSPGDPLARPADDPADEPGDRPATPPPSGPSGWAPPAPPSGGSTGGWAPPAPPQQSWQPPTPGGAVPGAPRPNAPANSKATAALVLGILGLPFFCPVLCSVPALIVGYKARNEIDRSGGTQSGRGSAQAGIIMGWIGTVIGVLAIVGLIIAIATGVIDEEDLEDGSDAEPDLQLQVIRVAGAAARLLVS